jgi:LysM repeat protein
MPQGGVQVGVGIGPPTSETQPNGLDVAAIDGATVTLVDANGLTLGAASLPRLVIGPFTFAINPTAPLSVTEAPILAMHMPPGGTPRYQAMGRGETRATLRGTLYGPTALVDLADLRALNGTRQPLSYGGLGAAACWPALSWDYRRDDLIDYTLQLAIEALLVSAGGLPTSADSFTFSGAVQAAGQAATPEPAAPAPATVAYVVVDGDTLWDIAQSKYGDGALFPVIARLNGIDDVRTLAVGSTIQLPSDRAAARALKAQQDARAAASVNPFAAGF